MSQGFRQNELQEKTQQLLQGPLKHVRAAALAAALLPLASVVATPATAQSTADCSSGGCGVVSGVVWDDANNKGVRDAGEAPIEGAKVFVCQLCDGTDTVATETGPDGTYSLLEYPGTYTLAVLIEPGTKTSPSNVGSDTFDSDGVPDGFGYSVASVTVSEGLTTTTDFGFFTPSVQQPGTGTPGYWKNHPEAWPVANITVGGVTYTKAAAIAWLGRVGTDKTTTMFSSLVPAMLNVMIGNDGSCVNSTIALANTWMAAHPVGSNVAASSDAWTIGEPLHMQMDVYNNGLLCAPHRN